MPTVTFGAGVVAVVEEGTSVLDAATSIGATRVECCGILPACGSCRMTVVAGGEHLTPPDALEADVRKAGRYLPFERLACMAHILGDVTVELER